MNELNAPLSRRAALRAAAAAALAPALALRAAAEVQAEETPPKGVARMKREAKALAPFVRSDLARRFLAAAEDALPTIPTRTLLRDPATRALLTEAEANKRDEAARKALQTVTLDEERYYDTKYGTPLAYARAVDLLAEVGKVPDVAGKRLLDFGYGTVGHLRLLAGLGAEVVGVDVDPFLTLLYSRPGDTGAVPASTAAKGRRAGRVTLVDGQWPADRATKDAVGGGFDAIVSKNTLKNGYLHPAQSVDKRMLVDLGVSDEAYVKALRDALKPGGVVLIYNLSPAPAKPGEPYKPWADGRCPFPREAWEKAGFAVVAFDVNDDKPAREMARLLKWDAPPTKMDVENDLFALYTVVRKK